MDTGTIPSKTFREAVLSLGGRACPDGLSRCIMVPADFLACSMADYRTALALAQVLGAELLLVHVIDTKTREVFA